MIDPDILVVCRERFLYDASTGKFFHRVDGRGKCKAGQRADLLKQGIGYRTVKVNGVRHRAHRLAWYMYYGEWPPGHIDHINCNPGDNRISNLRIATPLENNRHRVWWGMCRRQFGLLANLG